MLEFLQPFIGEIIVGAVMAFLGWFFERRKKKAEYSKSMIDIYQDALTDLKTRYDEKYAFLKNEYDLKFKHLTFQMDQLRKDQEMWKNKYSSLKKEFDAYKRKHQ